MMKKKNKPSVREQINALNEHIVNLHNRLSSMEVIVSAYIELKKDQMKLKKFLDKRAEETKKEAEKNEDNSTV